MVAAYARLQLDWLVFSNEHTNYTYHLTDLNVRDLAHFISSAIDADVHEARSYLDEILSDHDLRDHIADRVSNGGHGFEADKEARYGRRIGWYAIVRILKPRVIMETGTDKGLGSCVLASALLRNQQEGFPGRLYTVDIDSNAGWLLDHPYNQVVEIIINDSHSALNDFRLPIGIFIHDSFHEYSHEAKEYSLIDQNESAITPPVIISDNSHAGSALMDFAESNGLDYRFWAERPKRHFYPGGGIGLAVPCRRKQPQN